MSLQPLRTLTTRELPAQRGLDGPVPTRTSGQLHLYAPWRKGTNPTFQALPNVKLENANCVEKLRVVTLWKRDWLQHLTHISPNWLEAAPPRPVAPLPAFLRVGYPSTSVSSNPIYTPVNLSRMSSRIHATNDSTRSHGEDPSTWCTTSDQGHLVLLPGGSPVGGSLGFLVKNAEAGSNGGHLVERSLIDAAFIPVYTFGETPVGHTILDRGKVHRYSHQ